MPLLVSLVASACLGALIGLIRQWSEQDKSDVPDLGGVRTYSLWAMLGCLGAFASQQLASPLPLAATIALVGAQQLVTIARIPGGRHPGGTTFASVLLTLFVGSLVFWDQRQTAIVLAATTMVLLGLKQPIHTWTRAFTSGDLRATLQFAAVTGVVLPLVPNRAFGLFDAFNPYSTWLMVVLISGLGFAGYIAVRLVGAGAGIMLTSLFGGIASSTATTLTFSRRSKDDPQLSPHFALAVVVACTVMLPRLLVVIGVVNPALALSLVIPFAVMAAPGVAYAAWRWFKREPVANGIAAPSLHNPLNLRVALKFGAIYAVVTFLVKAFTRVGFNTGVLPLSFVSGLTDTDAISLSMAGNLSSGTLALSLATRAVIIASIANSLVKAAIAVSLGSPLLRRDSAIVLGLTSAAGAAAAIWLV
ncbi:MAG TPA: MgtC/SapB family protein [Opitutus sp.]|nr:MgtC/SapB family protein [Opitutus sp.]